MVRRSVDSGRSVRQVDAGKSRFHVWGPFHYLLICLFIESDSRELSGLPTIYESRWAVHRRDLIIRRRVRFVRAISVVPCLLNVFLLSVTSISSFIPGWATRFKALRTCFCLFYKFLSSNQFSDLLRTCGPIGWLGMLHWFPRRTTFRERWRLVRRAQ